MPEVVQQAEMPSLTNTMFMLNFCALWDHCACDSDNKQSLILFHQSRNAPIMLTSSSFT